MNGLVSGLMGALADESTALVQWLRRSVVLVQAGHGTGAGVIWHPDGLVITNHHVVQDGRVGVELAEGRVLPGRVVGVDPDNDLAALVVPAAGLPAASRGDSTTLRVGQVIVAVGHPFGLRDTATLGIISGVGPGAWMGRWRRDVVQADVELAPGNSGGPLATTDGRVVGVASMIVSPGIAIAVPTHVVERFVARLNAGTARSARGG